MRFDRRLRSLLGLGFLLAWMAQGCADFHRGPAAGDGGRDSFSDQALVPDFVFETAVYPLLQLRCQECHSAGREGEYTQFVISGNARLDRSMVVRLLVPGDPSASLLLRRATGEAHTGRDVLTADTPDYDTIADWVRGLSP